MMWFSQYSYQFLFGAYLHISELPKSCMDGDANIYVFVKTSQRVSLWLDHMGTRILECGEMLGFNCKV